MTISPLIPVVGLVLIVANIFLGWSIRRVANGDGVQLFIAAWSRFLLR